MKNIAAILNRKFIGTIVVFGWLSRMALASDPTALSLIKEANDYVGKDARDKVVQIRSDKSVGTLTPVIWYVVFYDPDASFKATEVKFAAGKKVNTSRPFRVLEYVKADKVFDRTKIKTDSDDAIKIATSEPLLKNLTLKATQLWLDSNYKADLSVTGPIWKVRFWAAKLRNPNDNADIGEVWITAEDGKVVRTDLHIDRVD
jgi:hypothetical protein